MKIQVVILYGGIKNKTFEVTDPKYKKSYEIISQLAKEKNVDIFFSGMAFWNGKNFNKASYYDSILNKWMYVKNIHPDLIYDKITTSFSNVSLKKNLEKEIPVLNPSFFDLICNNKFLNYLIFEEFYPKSFLVSNIQEIKRKLRHIKTAKLVIKPTVGTCGNNVKIISRKEIEKLRIENDHFLLQEFIDSSEGILNVVAGVHDLRITIIDNKIIYAYFRTPKKGSLLCNIAKGGKMKIINNSKIPKEAKVVCRKIMQKLAPFENLIYSVDFAMDKHGKMKIIEMNSRPGVFFYPEDEKIRDKYYVAFINNIIKYLEKIK